MNMLQVPVARPIARHPAKRSADYQVPGQLDQYVTVLHVPAAPPAWMQMCRAVERQGAAAFKPWMLDKPCDLPDVQGSSGWLQIRMVKQHPAPPKWLENSSQLWKRWFIIQSSSNQAAPEHAELTEPPPLRPLLVCRGTLPARQAALGP
jgi:hypothetical protein